MEKCGERLLHPYRRAPPADIAGERQQLLHRGHLGAFHPRGAGRLLEVHLAVAGHHAHKMTAARGSGALPFRARRFATQHQGLENLTYILAQLLSHMCGGKIVGVNFIRHCGVSHAGFVKKPCGIGFNLFFLLSHDIDQSAARPAKRQTCCRHAFLNGLYC